MRDETEPAAVVLAEPCFELPPRLAATPERRLTAYAEASFRLGEAAHAFRDNALTLVRGEHRVVQVATVGRAVTIGLGILPGPLSGSDDSLAAVLIASFAAAEAGSRVTPFEAAVSAPAAACVLLRGVLMPTVAGADVVLSWKQVLDDDATALLRAELLRELRPRDRRTALVNVFA